MQHDAVIFQISVSSISEQLKYNTNDSKYHTETTLDNSCITQLLKHVFSSLAMLLIDVRIVDRSLANVGMHLRVAL